MKHTPPRSDAARRCLAVETSTDRVDTSPRYSLRHSLTRFHVKPRASARSRSTALWGRAPVAWGMCPHARGDSVSRETWNAVATREGAPPKACQRVPVHMRHELFRGNRHQRTTWARRSQRRAHVSRETVLVLVQGGSWCQCADNASQVLLAGELDGDASLLGTTRDLDASVESI